MGIIHNILGSFTVRGKALSLYKRGIKKAEQRDLEGAIIDYTAVIEMSGVPGDVRAMALLNRALAYSRRHDDEKAHKDLKLVLAMDEATAQVKAAAREKVDRMKRARSIARDHTV